MEHDMIEFFELLVDLADEEPVDQKKYFEDSCKPKCVRAWLEYQVPSVNPLNHKFNH
ncbi:putative ubiquinol-cytochrome C reductase hinge domain superfamily [Helianthus anomalus]